MSKPMRFLFGLLLLLAFGCTSAPVAPAPTGGPATTPLPGPGQPGIEYLALGDSYTIGEGAAAEDRWGVQLSRQAQAQGLNLLTPDIIARTGWTTAELQQAIRAANVQKTYGLVSLLIGVNNQYRGLPLAAYRTEFRQLLQTAVTFAGGRPGRVVVLSIPDWGRSPFARGRDQDKISGEIDQFNAVAKEECQQAGVAYVDITPLTRSAAGDMSQFTNDGLHYSGKQMALWAQQALPTVHNLLK
ncbi:SGNH/GDSL hydrolase family protein [Hymenobacter sp. BT18]|uniref:SGNH/GDSL hydrolase family protein n=1 Tax=Hymenobacter sp. BT18 TaxID=2835648 RepID=UPI001E5BCB63|nr:SGNH/GDSL hydrolase family protein [Hymenobacter sp. BT18]